MAGFFKFSRQHDANVAAAEVTPVNDNINNTVGDEKTPNVEDGIRESESGDEKHRHELEKDAQTGVQEVEAVTLTWTRSSLISAFVLMFLLYMVNAFQSTILYSLTPFVTSKFAAHSMLNVISVVSGAMTAALYIPVAKILDLWGRAEGFLIMTCFATLGLILMATSNSLAHFCAAQVFYSVGFGGMTYCIDVITADISKLKNRGLAYAFTSSPYMITAFAGPKAAEDFYEKVSWRWGFGCFAIILPFVAMPLFFLLRVNLKKARAQGIVAKQPSGRTFLQSIWFYFIEFDGAGCFLFAAGLTTFLLPFTLAYYAPNGWKSGYIIAMIIVGFIVLVGFGLFETYIAPKPFLKHDFLTDRTVIGACLLDATYQVSYYCWANYFSSFLLVVNGVSIAESGYIGNTFNVVSGFLLFIVGFAIRKTGRFKWLLYGAVPLYLLAQGLMIYFRGTTKNVGYLVMCQVFISIGGSVFIIVQQISILAAVDHQHVAAALALLFVVGTTGGAIGSTISGAIWTNTFEKALGWYLPESEQGNVSTIALDVEVQLSYEWGSVERIAIQDAYRYAQTRMLAAGVGFMSLAILWTLFFRNINLHKLQQTKGMVF
ncbi:MFS transporter [Dactylonectria estremocensis]|uniref:MFS transporter n=1 Tax=Dactylonectria estremocensis TaxID=1079267 RepID=A0A9P9DZD7_9HYPO|nr:MFS transporter [Dactylonectria estremocensis]